METPITLVTGASSGLGRDTATLLCKKGHTIYAVARTRSDLISLQKECANQSGKIKILVGDLTNPKIRISIIKTILKESNHLDYLINNAGYGKLGALEKIEYKDIEGMFALNVIAMQHLAQLALPSMLSRKKGRIINIASVAALQPPVFFASYNATKYATYGFTRSMSYDLHGSGVSMSAVFPPRMDTPFWIRAFKCKGLTGKDQDMCVADYMKQSSPSLKVAKHIVNNLDSTNVLILPGLLPKVAYYILRHFYFIGDFYMKHFMLPKSKKTLHYS
ncbi:hypothetical protein CMI47_17475 [Candidatus Pacearchaeota archaeon]|nr:hypothetical protein [Candidatus Pacearchaeota archaeon]|tara:strand:- start:10719 stop:11546 length:828 start_codon:yes stop_codon:yes gene_type:complete